MPTTSTKSTPLKFLKIILACCFSFIPLQVLAQAQAETSIKSADGAYISKGKLEDGKKVGIWEVYATKGTSKGKQQTIHSRGAYRGRQKHGIWTYYHANGRKKEQGNYNKGKRTGLWSGWSPKGEMYLQRGYKADRFHGPTISFYTDGKLHSKRTYKDGKLTGWLFAYNHDGSLQFKVNTETPKPVEVIAYHPGKKIAGKGMHHRGKNVGLWTFYYETGQKRALVSYKDGKQNGKTSYFNKNGQLVSVSHYKDSKLHGLYTTPSKSKAHQTPTSKSRFKTWKG